MRNSDKRHGNPRRPPFKVGDLVTGKEQSYQRSIYKVLASTEDRGKGMFEFVSLGCDVIQRHRDMKKTYSFFTFTRPYDEFRLATRQEINRSINATIRYALRRLVDMLGIKPDSDSIFP